jgi:hypothetical protein
MPQIQASNWQKPAQPTCSARINSGISRVSLGFLHVTPLSAEGMDAIAGSQVHCCGKAEILPMAEAAWKMKNWCIAPNTFHTLFL